MLGRVRCVTAAESLSEGVLLNLDALHERRSTKSRAADEARPVPKAQADPDHRQQPAQVGRMAYEDVGTGLDHLVVGLDLDRGREEPSKRRH